MGYLGRTKKCEFYSEYGDEFIVRALRTEAGESSRRGIRNGKKKKGVNIYGTENY